MKRRFFLKSSAVSVLTAIGAGIMKPVWALTNWPENAFKSEVIDGALTDIFGTAEATESDQVVLKAPLQAENGAVVPIKVTTTLPNPTRIAVFAEKNPRPLAAVVNLGEGSSGFYSARIKMATTSPVKAYVESEGKVYMAVQEIKVTVGGCGG